MTLRGNTKYQQHYGSVRVTQPTIEVVLLDDLKSHIRVTHNDDDEYLNKLIKEAREEFEDITGIALISQTWQFMLDAWPGRRDQWWDGVQQMAITELDGGFPAIMEPPRYPLISVDTVNVYDESSNATAVTIASTFDIDIISRPGRIALQSGATWPIASRTVNAIEINYTAGYGSTVSNVPSPLVRAVRNMAGYMYDHRGAGCTPSQAYRESGAMTIAKTYRVVRL
jgi:hypothetical protein